MRATTADHASIPDRAATSDASGSTLNLGLRVLAKYGPLNAIALGSVAVVCWMLVSNLNQMHQEHDVIARLLYAQCYNSANGDPQKIGVCLNAFQGR